MIAAIDWVVAHRKTDGLDIRVLNLSFGTDSVQPAQLDPLAHAVGGVALDGERDIHGSPWIPGVWAPRQHHRRLVVGRDLQRGLLVGSLLVGRLLVRRLLVRRLLVRSELERDDLERGVLVGQRLGRSGRLIRLAPGQGRWRGVT